MENKICYGIEIIILLLFCGYLILQSVKIYSILGIMVWGMLDMLILDDLTEDLIGWFKRRNKNGRLEN